MNDLCFKTQKEFDKAEQEFVEFPDNMYNIFYEYHKTIQDNPSPVRKAFKEYFNEIFTKLLTSEVNNRFICSMQFWTTFKSLPRDSLGNKSNCDHPDTWESYFQKPLL